MFKCGKPLSFFRQCKEVSALKGIIKGFTRITSTREAGGYRIPQVTARVI